MDKNGSANDSGIATPESSLCPDHIGKPVELQLVVNKTLAVSDFEILDSLIKKHQHQILRQKCPLYQIIAKTGLDNVFLVKFPNDSKFYRAVSPGSGQLLLVDYRTTEGADFSFEYFEIENLPDIKNHVCPKLHPKNPIKLTKRVFNFIEFLQSQQIEFLFHENEILIKNFEGRQNLPLRKTVRDILRGSKPQVQKNVIIQNQVYQKFEYPMYNVRCLMPKTYELFGKYGSITTKLATPVNANYGMLVVFLKFE